MFEVQQSHKNKKVLISKKLKGARGHQEVKKSNLFSENLKGFYQTQFKSEVTNFIVTLNQAGDIFAVDPSENHLIDYKSKVQAFLNFALHNTYTIEEIYGKRMDYKIVRTINNELEKLYKSFLQKELPKLSLLAKLDEIRGLIIDLIL